MRRIKRMVQEYCGNINRSGTIIEILGQFLTKMLYIFFNAMCLIYMIHRYPQTKHNYLYQIYKTNTNLSIHLKRYY